MVWSTVAQPAAASAPGTSADLVAQLQTRLAEARLDLAAAFTPSAQSTNLPPGATTAEAQEYHLIAESLVRTYQEHLEQISRLEEAESRAKEISQRSQSWAGFSEPAPYSILLVDELRDSVQSLSAEITASETTRDVLTTLLGDVESALKKSDERLRLLTEQLETEKETPRMTRLAWQRSLEQMLNRHAAATLALNATRRQKAEIDLTEHRLRLALVRRQLSVASAQVRYSQSDLDRVLAGLDAEQRGVESEIPEAERIYEESRTALATARKELGKTSTGTELAAGARDARLRQLQAVVELREAQVETSAQRLVVLRQLADTAVRERGMWQMRFSAFHSRDLSTLRQGYLRLDQLSRLIRSVKPHFQQQIDLAAGLISEQRNRVQDQVNAKFDPAIVEQLIDSYRQREELAHRALGSLQRIERLAARWQDSLDADRRQLPFTARVRDLFGGFSSFTAKLWNFELFTAEDTVTVDGQKITARRSVTVGKVVSAILILAVGYWLTIFLSRLLERMAVKRFKVEPNQANLVRRWVRVVLVFALVVFSLVSVKIPLTVFAFLGGALAIGLGFGTQNLLKNFISGIIILFERPFRVGDVLDISGHRGVVISVGIRSSILKLFDGTETLIPNSALLENNVTNWTYSDRKVRFSVVVGVAYGSDTRRVSQLLAEAAERHGLVEKEPAPQIIFQEFSDSALTFELRYWVDVIKQNASQIGSDLRHMIAGSLTENRIVIAFPQRDLHLDVSQPLPVQIVPAPPAPANSTAPAAPEASDPAKTKTGLPA